MANKAAVNHLRDVLRQIRREAQEVIQGDANPNKGDLYRIDKLAHDALRATK